jgi:hypothetical protein
MTMGPRTLSLQAPVRRRIDVSDTHTIERTRRAPFSAVEPAQVADVTKRLSVMRAALEAGRRDHERLQRSRELLRAENLWLRQQLNQLPATTEHPAARRAAPRDPCSINP